MESHRRTRSEDRHKCSLRIPDDGEAADGRDLFRLLMHLSTQLPCERCRRIDVLNLDVRHPVRWSAHLFRLLRKLHDTTKRPLTANPHEVIVSFSEWLCLPPNDI